MRPHDAILAALQRASDALVIASDGQLAANRAMIDAFAASHRAHTEHEDLRESVARLERLVLDQSADLRALRQRLDAGGGGVG